ncbi:MULTISPECIES: sulfatase-like hydrolase/transferase [Arthrobacter]|uniref:sulfatase-like hydrolase/transferase n=1 Tax=Arthrobacter TaxID=1663 RepID=UPI000B1F5CD4|nr:MULTISPECIES: sulfatase-like hydrolase/transferase [Arthrobacter]
MEMYLDIPAFNRRLGDWEHHYESARTNGNHQLSFGTLSAAAMHRARAGYYGLMTHIDLQLMSLQVALTGVELNENTIIAFTSDHGEMLGDHDFYRKAVGHEGSARVPLIIMPAPSDAAALHGAVVDEVVELRDIMPTLLDLAGVTVPDYCDGKSLARFLRTDVGATDPQPWREWLHGEHVYFGQ